MSERILKKVELWMFDHESFFGMIVPCHTGIIWTNQCGGTSCTHPEQEGIFVPLPGFWIPDLEDLTDLWSTASHTEQISVWLNASEELSQAFEALDHNPLAALGEAWVPVRVVNKGNETILAPFVNDIVILTYANSD